MGFPAPVFSECEVPRLLLNLIFLLARLRRLSSWPLRLVSAGVDDDLSFDNSTASGITDHHRHHQEQYDDSEDRCLEELEKHSLAMRFDALSGAGVEAMLLLESCAVCLGDFHGATRVRRHVFHRACLDHWAAHGRRTCPLSRAPLLPCFLLPLPLLLARRYLDEGIIKQLWSTCSCAPGEILGSPDRAMAALWCRVPSWGHHLWSGAGWNRREVVWRAFSRVDDGGSRRHGAAGSRRWTWHDGLAQGGGAV
ncbi:uncharacterized protein LOC119284305 [Triticum dicoccoides]|uniref:uncharacterized protein LOC119284305 n=1 Tax=Triticum dicoccoides TaxID=85692 RepID=UPI00188F2EDC|nr:uncharacterized protein LOC119284305 [Triticum dicoccoides]